MNWWLPHNFEKRRPLLEVRAALMQAVRAFFDKKGFLEVETPVLQVCPVMDTHIHAFKTTLNGPNLTPARELYLHTSPEFAMKKLLVAGLPKIFQICPVFRNSDDSRLHSPEFTLLEWYRADAGYRDIMEDSIGLLRHVAISRKIGSYRHRDLISDPFMDWNIISIAEAFEKYAGIRLADYLDDVDAFADIISKSGIRTAPDDQWDDLFFRVMAERIEPNLGHPAPCILYDYPASMASLARKKPGDPRWAERFEIYVCGIELANGFGELTDAAEQRARFQEEMDLKEARYGIRYPVDEDFLKALEYGLPESGGNALGLDRLIMLATGAENIETILWAGKP